MSAEKQIGYREANLESAFTKLVRLLGASALMFSLESCGSVKALNPEGAVSPPSATKPNSAAPEFPLVLTLNMSGFLTEATTCRNGGLRPCAALVRTAPNLQAGFINSDAADDQLVAWPIEPYAGQPGSAVAVECVAAGGIDADYAGNPPSNLWYRVEVPAGRIVNLAVAHAAGGQTSVSGYIPILDFYPFGGAPKVAVC